ncbi:MAG TPA: 3-hydroxyacyl-CoA dehydrogenase NAD-binding domain-containing protein [Solirubrobacteraceae bacterium]
MPDGAAGRIGVLGAGTMGAGIAQLAAQSGAVAWLHDPDGAALERGLAAARGRLEKQGADPARLQPAVELAALDGCDLVVEAAPESLDLKRALFGSVAAVVGDACVLATNTSSLSVTAIAAGVPRPERVVGMHFFNPAPVMKLVEVVAGEQSGEHALALARATGEAMGRRVIDAADSPGFLVNRCNRPFGLEALRIVQERLATVEQVDRIVRLGGGFRMGPFELMDLVGLDVGLDVAKSFFAQSFGEPRWRPSPLVERLVAAGRLGRKSGHGWYAYPDGRPEDPPAPAPGGGDGLVIIAGESALAADLLESAVVAGWDAAAPDEADGEVPFLIVDCGGGEDDPPLQGGPQVLLCDAAPLAALDAGGASAGFYALPGAGLVELTRSLGTSDAAARAAERFFASLGRHVEWVGDAPGLVLGRIVCQLVNEACFAVGEGVGTPEDVDAGMVLGLNHPRGPLERGDAIGPIEVLAVLLGLQDEYREERYRPAPVLMRAARGGGALSGGA